MTPSGAVGQQGADGNLLLAEDTLGGSGEMERAGWYDGGKEGRYLFAWNQIDICRYLFEGKQGQEHRRWIQTVLPERKVQKGREMEQQSMCVVEVKRASDRNKILKLVIKGLLLNVVSAYTPQVDCQDTKRNSGVSWMKWKRVYRGWRW